MARLYTSVRSGADAVFLQLLAQGGTVDAQHRGGTALVAFAVIEHFHEQRNLHLAQHDLVDIVRIAAIKVTQVAAHGLGDVFTQRWPGSATTVVRTRKDSVQGGSRFGWPVRAERAAGRGGGGQSSASVPGLPRLVASPRSEEVEGECDGGRSGLLQPEGDARALARFQQGCTGVLAQVLRGREHAAADHPAIGIGQ